MSGILQSVPMVLVTVLAFGLLIVIHELGHYLAARWSGMRVERFSIGFGPVVWSSRRGDTEWAVSAVPLGGYVKIAGMAPGEDLPEGDTGAYSAKPAWKRFLVILAGPAMNYLLAVVLAVLLIATMGLKEPDQTAGVGDVLPGGAAERAGLRAGDRIVTAGGAPVADWKGLVEAIRAHPGQDLVLGVVRAGDGAGAPVPVTLRPDDAGGVGKAGIAPSLRTVRAGAAPFLMMVWLISSMLAIFNFLPLPALDGGRLAFLGYEIVTRRPVNQRVEALIHTVGFVLLLGLLLGVTLFGDLPRLFRR